VSAVLLTGLKITDLKDFSDPEKTYTLFCQRRKDSFAGIESRIRAASKSRDLLAQAWNAAIREEVEQLWVEKSDDNDSPLLEQAEAVDWVAHKTQHQICKDIVKTERIYESVLETVRKGPFGFELGDDTPRECE